MEYCSAIKRDELLLHTTWINIKIILSGKKSQRPLPTKKKYMPNVSTLKKKYIESANYSETESRPAVA